MPPTPTKPKKPKKLPPRGERGRFIKSGEPARAAEPVRPRAPEPELLDMPEYSPHRVGIGERIDWERDLSREVLPPRRAHKPRRRDGGALGWGVIAAGALGFGYALSRLPHKKR